MRPIFALSFIIQMGDETVADLLASLSSPLKRDTRAYIRALQDHKQGLNETPESLIRKGREMIFPVKDGIAIVSTDTHPDYAGALCVQALNVMNSDDVITFGASSKSSVKFPYPVDAVFYGANRNGFIALRIDDPASAIIIRGELSKRTTRSARSP